MQSIFDAHRAAVAELRAVVAHVTPADLDRPTPCADWDLRALLEHMTGQDRGFAAAVRAAADGGEETAVSAFAPRPLGPSPATEVAAGAEEVAAAFTETAFTETRDPERPVLLAEFDARLPLHVVAGMHLIDTLVHGWDVAAALDRQAGYGSALDPGVVAVGLAIAERIPDDDARTVPGAAFGHAVVAPEGADAWSRTLGLLGRDPAWASATSHPSSPGPTARSVGTV